MSDIDQPRRRRFQFGLRRGLAWTAVVALGLGVLSSLEPNAVIWIVYPSWFAIVLILRWRFGGRVAAGISVIAGMLLFALLCGSIWAATSRRLEPVEVVMIAVVGAFLGGFVGFVLFLLAEAARRAVNRIDRIGQADE